MSDCIKVGGIDMALANVGLVRALVHPNGEVRAVCDLQLVKTKKTDAKQVRQNSDDLRRARELTAAIRSLESWADILIAEVPTGAQSARAATSFGVALGILAGLNKPLVEVLPRDVKLVSVGSQKASKEQIIRWAVGKHPAANWLTRKFRGQTELIDDNEHLADAVAAIYAGVESQQFKMLTVAHAMYRKAA